MVQWDGISYGKYKYPGWAEFCGWVLALASMLWIPCVAIYTVVRSPGSTWSERLSHAVNPDPNIIRQVELREGIPSEMQVIAL